MILKRKRDVERLSDIEFGTELSGYNIPRIRRVYPQMMSNVTVGVMPTTQPQGLYFALRYLYGENEVLPKMEKNQTPEMKIKPKVHHHHKPEVSKVQLRPKNWNANPGRNESRQKYRFR